MGGRGRKKEIGNDISAFKLKTSRELPSNAMGKAARRSSGPCVVCACTHACRGSGFQSWIREFEIWVRHKNGDAELVDGSIGNRSDASDRDL